MSQEMRIIWLEKALEHVQELKNFYTQVNASFAAKIVKTIFDSTAILEQFPQLAPVDPYFEGNEVEVRSLVIMKGRFRILYYLKDRHILIAAVLDCRQNLSGILIH